MLVDENFNFKPIDPRELSIELGLPHDLNISLPYIIKESTSSTNILPIHHLVIRLLQAYQNRHLEEPVHMNLLSKFSELISGYGYKYFILLDTVLSSSSNNLINAFYENIIRLAPFSSSLIFPYVNRGLPNELKSVEFVMDRVSGEMDDISYQYIVYNIKSILEIEKLLSSKYKYFKSLVIDSDLINEAFIKEYAAPILEYLRRYVKNIILYPLKKFKLSSNGIVVRKDIIIPIALDLTKSSKFSVNYISQVIDEAVMICRSILGKNIGLNDNHKFLIRLSGHANYNYIKDLVNILSKSYLVGVDENASKDLFNYLSSLKQLSSFRIFHLPIYSYENLTNTLKSYIKDNINIPVSLEYKGF